MTAPAAVLVLEDGTVLRGTAFGAVDPSANAPADPPDTDPSNTDPSNTDPSNTVFGEIVFNTGMTGYQETLTDPSYHRQIVTMTAPHIGNTGINDEDNESRRIWVAGYVVREPARIASSWRARRSLDDELRAQGVLGIAVTGTRALTRHLRDSGAMRAAISAAPADTADPRGLVERVLASPSMTGADLAREVSTPEPYVVRPLDGTVKYRVAAVDLGIKTATPRRMAERGCEVHVLPATSTTAEILAIEPDGVFFSNGPGDPAAAGYAVESMRGLLTVRVPVFGICLGSQILGRALGLGTYKLLFGHRGVNQPVADLETGRVQITSHNHGFAVAPPGTGANGATPHGPAFPDRSRHAEPFSTSYGRAQVSHVCLNDGVVEGLRLLDRPAFSVQYHPEAAPGPHDATGLFDRFCELMAGRKVEG
ncbi:MAG: glutamine-hydrolyzing carbamoyl-phosphate synthase small subunit [Micromonosporaceae bacterium]